MKLLLGLKNKKGFSLIETIIYISILAVTLVLVTETMLAMVRSYGDLKVSKEINTSSLSVLERMTREIRWAYDVDVAQSIFNANPGRLSLKTKDSSGTDMTVEFFVEDDALKIKENGVIKGSLMQSNVSITNLIFKFIDTGRSKMIKVEMTLQGVGLKGKVRSEKFYDSVVLRGSY